MLRRRLNRYGGAQPKIWYHGTSVRHLRSILVHGLQGSRKSRYTGEMEALGGVYMSSSPGTAWEYALDFVGHTTPPSALMVAAQIQPRSLVLDEDMVMSELDLQMIPRGISSDQHTAANIYLDIASGSVNTQTDKYWKEYVSNVLKYVIFYTQNRNQRFIAHVEEFAHDAFPIALQYFIVRRVHEDKWDSDDTRWLPSFEKANNEFRKLLDSFTKLLRKYTLSAEKGRYLGDLGFSGRNKIVSIFSFEAAPKPLRGVLLTKHYGTIPNAALNFFTGYYSHIEIQ